MFLFTTLDRTDNVQSALHHASRNTGVDFGYLLATAQRESGLDPSAKAATSSASGLFQFIESTWLSTLKEAGPRHGYGDLARHVETASDGRPRVPDPAVRAEILALRHDPKIAALMAGELTRSNATLLERGLGRDPSEGELYIAHFLGARGATQLIRQVETAPQTAAAQLLPAAAKANRPIFYTGDGNPRSVREVYAELIARHDGTDGAPRPAETVAANGPDSRPADGLFHGLFGDAREGGLGPIARAVGAFWSGLFTTVEEPDAGDGVSPPAAATAHAYAPARQEHAPPLVAGEGASGPERPWRWQDPSLPVR